MGGVEATELNNKRMVEYGSRLGGGISKASADFTQSCRKLNRRSSGAGRLRRQAWLLHGAGPPGCVNLGGPFLLGGVTMTDDDIPLHLMYGANHLAMDEAFRARMHAAIDRAGNCSDWCRHHARDQQSKIRPNRASLSASLP